MPGKRKDEQSDTLGQIFDFIFTEAEKPPDKRKPMKVTGLSSTDPLVDAMAAALEKPGVFVSNQILETLDEALDLELGVVKADDIGLGKVKITTGNFIDIVKDPSGYWDKAFKTSEAIRKSMRAQFVGKEVQKLLGYSLAKRYDLDLDIQRAINGSYDALHLHRDSDREDRRKSFTQSQATATVAAGSTYVRGSEKGPNMLFTKDKGHLMERSSELLGREILGLNKWNSLSDEEKQDIQKIISEGEDVLDNIQGRLRISSSERSQMQARYGQLGRSGISLKNDDVGNYIKLEEANVDRKILELSSQRNLTPEEQIRVNVAIRNLEKAKLLIKGQVLTTENIKNARDGIRSTIDEYKRGMEDANRRGDREAAKLYRDNIRDLRSSYRDLAAISLVGRIGQIEGWIGSINNIYKDGKALQSVLSGDFFDYNKNKVFCPTNEEKFKINGQEIEFFAAYESRHKAVNVYNNVMAEVYYLTPRSILRTLFINGEGFAHQAHKRMKKINNQFGLRIDMEKLLSEESQKYIDTLLKGLKPEDAEMLLKQLKGVKGFGRATQTFSFLSRMQAGVTDRLNKAVFENARKRIEKALLSSRLGKSMFKKGAEKMLSEWVANGGMQVFARSIAMGIANLFGIVVTGGIGNLFVMGVSFVVTEVGYKALKVIFVTLTWVAIGLVGLIFWGLSAGTDVLERNNTYAQTVPGDVIQCADYRGIEPIVDDPDVFDGELEDFVAGSLPSGVSCLLGDGAYRCTQGPNSSSGHSHHGLVANDYGYIGNFYSPSFCGDNNCVVTYSGDVNCKAGYAGGMLIFNAEYEGTTYTFKLIHVVPGYSVGDYLPGGESVATIISNNEIIEECSSGPHLHLETKVNGATVNPYDVLTSSTVDGGFGCSITECPDL